jgi:hypothetical protein
LTMTFFNPFSQAIANCTKTPHSSEHCRIRLVFGYDVSKQGLFPAKVLYVFRLPKEAFGRIRQLKGYGRPLAGHLEGLGTPNSS